ncbi:MAG TPA: alpha/beta family hydrolase [Dehalococcoidia bacterium]|nr:alpha/beta family hydrolase [Dehalococcoidia bacterium]
MHTQQKDTVVNIEVPGGTVSGDLVIPTESEGIVLFAHGSGSGRHSPRNRQVAHVLQASKIATLLFDLLTPEEERTDERTGEFRFDIELLASRTIAALRWLHESADTQHLPVGIFGASTGAAAALMAAAEHPTRVYAVVSRGGRPDLARPQLSRVRAPVLLIVGGRDVEVLQLNREALALLPFEKELCVVEGATHLFEEPGALDEVAKLSADWFRGHFAEDIV